MTKDEARELIVEVAKLFAWPVLIGLVVGVMFALAIMWRLG